MTFEIIFVLLALVGMVIALILDKMRPGMVLFSVVVLFLCAGILTPKEMLEGFSNKGMITVAMLFLVSEGIRQSGALGQLIKKLLPQGKTTVFKAQLRMLPIISFISAFLNNTPVVVIFAPIIKRWAESVKLPATKFLIPLSYVTILEVYVSTPIEECERRDVKGLYAKARRGEIKNFTGISAPFEAPAQPALVLDTSALSLEESVNKLLELILPRIQKK